jgi:hypothetical protein
LAIGNRRFKIQEANPQGAPGQAERVRILNPIVLVTVYTNPYMAMDRQHAHKLLDQLAPAQLAAVVHLLETMVSPDEDRDTLSNAESKAIAEADEWLKHHPPIPHEEILADFGLTPDDWEKMGKEPAPEAPPRRNG